VTIIWNRPDLNGEGPFVGEITADGDVVGRLSMGVHERSRIRRGVINQVHRENSTGRGAISIAYSMTVSMLGLDILCSDFKRTEAGSRLWTKLRPKQDLKKLEIHHGRYDEMFSDAELNEAEPEIVRREVYVLCKDVITCCRAAAIWYAGTGDVIILKEGEPIDCDQVASDEYQREEDERIEEMLRKQESET